MHKMLQNTQRALKNVKTDQAVMNSRNRNQHYSTNKIIYQNYDQELKMLLEQE